MKLSLLGLITDLKKILPENNGPDTPGTLSQDQNEAFPGIARKAQGEN